jgi:heme-degrading monooxygenase HmoA
MTVVSVLRLPVTPAGRGSFARTFHELGVFERSHESGGFLTGRLLRPLDETGAFLVIAEWEDAAAYERWLTNPVRAGLGERLQRLVTSEVAAGELFEEAV